MEITVKTERYTAQELQKLINGETLLCVVVGAGRVHEYVVIVNNEMMGALVRGMLKHLEVEEIGNL